MAAPITKLRIGLKPDTPEEHTRLLIDVNTEEAQTSLQITTDLRVRANPATAKIYYYNFDGSELLYTETIEPGGNGSWDGEPGRASTAQYEFIFNGWSTEPDQVDPTEDATAGVYSERRVYAAYKRRDIRGFVRFSSLDAFSLKTRNGIKNWDGLLLISQDASSWQEWTGQSFDSGFNGNEFELFLKGENNTIITGNESKSYSFEFTYSSQNRGIVCTGDIRTLLDYRIALSNNDPEMGAKCFASIFIDSILTKAPELPATALANNCYHSMFRGCTGLTEAPELPATTLAQYCYQSMFYGCTGLTKAPELPATTLANNCYQLMFWGCTGLTEAPELPVTTLTPYCYQGMFRGCTGLTEAPDLPATVLTNGCYQSMFQDCTGLTEAPELPATVLTSGCYQSMFQGCTGLTEAPELPATTLASSCYQSMFQSCTGLTEAPELPVTTLAQYCYQSMFQDCTNLTRPSILQAIILARNCYRSMFEGCLKIRLSSESVDEYTEPYRIPAAGDGAASQDALTNMFYRTGGTFTGTPVINTTYYLAPPASA